MRTYKNLSGNSGIAAYEIGKTFIKIKFTGGDVYTYNYKNPGRQVVELMKSLALKGEGLGNYIMEEVKNNYAFTG